MPVVLERLGAAAFSDTLDAPARLRAVERAGLLDPGTWSDAAARWARRARRTLDAPSAAVSTLGGQEQHVHAALGLPGVTAGRRAPREEAVCLHVVGHGEAVAIHDALAHPFTAASPLPRHGLRSYLGAPVTLDGQPVGVLCVADPEPRRWTDEDVARLADLADGLSAELALRLTEDDLRRRDALLAATLEELQAMREAVAAAEQRQSAAAAAAPQAAIVAAHWPRRGAAAADASRRARLEAALRGALDRGGLHLVAQPVVTCGAGALHAVETLLRWDDPELGAIGPAEFVPIAERTGAIDAIGRWVVREACRALADLDHGLGRAVQLAVNVSPRQLEHPAFADAVDDALRTHGIAPSRLVLEITETALLGTDPATDRTLHALREIGVSLVLDDFGTGFSSLSMLKDRPIDGIKIDRSFVGGLPGDGTSAAIVGGVVAMARALGRTVTAEGIETRAQLAHLQALGCDYAQGWLLGRPVPFGELPSLCR